MDLDLTGKVAVVGGASQGIGYGIARQLASEGARVVMFARREAMLLEAAARLREETGAAIVAVQGDGRRPDDCSRIIEAAIRGFGALDILVNNDGAPPLGNVNDFDDAAWAAAVQQNLMYVVRMARLAVPHMVARGGGSILNIAALSAIQPAAGFGLSVATWGGVIGFSKTLSLEVARQNINVNTICPGYIDTQRLEKVFASSADAGQVRRQLLDEVPMGRIGTPEDIAALVALLVSPCGRYITGTAIAVDGGLFRGVR
jgi:3-oxoacyl-[acyl-carrier protein] reductase